MSEFYDEDWHRLQKQNPLAAKKLEELRCESVSYVEFEELERKFNKLLASLKPKKKFNREEEV